MDVLHKDLNLRIEDFGADAHGASAIKDYDSLLNDYMRKRGDNGVVHVATIDQVTGNYVPFF
jgi:hypothetical protein